LTVKATIGLLPGLDVHALAARERPLLLLSSPVGEAALSRKSIASDSRVRACRKCLRSAITTGRCDGRHCESGKTRDKSA
jgi:hypothetical protein